MMLLSLIALLLQDPYVRTHDQEVRAAHSPGTLAPLVPSGREMIFPVPCSTSAAGKHGEPVPGGGTLSPSAFANPSTIIGALSGNARTAFVSQVSGATRNQGVFVHDGTTLTPIARGCGALGGGGSTGTCGDPTPIGGTFSGFFTGTVFAPAVNAAGDVLFYAEVVGGSSSRGLFLYRAGTASIVKVAVVGDASPLGGTFAMIGPGTVNASGSVAFLASDTTAGPSDVFLWNGVSVSSVAAVGDVAPLGNTYQFLGTESFGFVDGSTIPAGPVPDIDDAGDVAFRAITAGERGIVVRSAGGGAAWAVRDNEPSPLGGTFLDFQGPNLNNAGELAFFADARLGPSSFNSGLVAGTPGNWRKVIAFGDAVGGGVCNGLAYSRNPMSFLDDAGNVILWTDVLLPGGSSREHIVVGAPDGALTIVARKNDPTPLGGTYNVFDAWPSLDAHGRGSFSASMPSSGVLSAHLVFTTCPAASATVRNGSGANALCFAALPPVLGSAWSATVDASGHPGASATAIYAHVLPDSGTFLPAGELLLNLSSPRIFVSVRPGSGLVVHNGTIPSSAALAGVTASLQGLVLGGGLELCNGVDVVLGY